MRFRVVGSGNQGGYTFIYLLLREGHMQRAEDHVILANEWEFTFDGNGDTLMFLRAAQQESFDTTDKIERIDVLS